MFLKILFLFISVLLIPFSNASACSSCVIPQIGKSNNVVSNLTKDGRWFFEYMFEQKNWHEKEGKEGHALHHAGHHFHSKTTEDFHHYKITGNLNEAVSVSLDLPYVIRRSIEVDDHSILGLDQVSEGLGDMTMVGQYRFLRQEDFSLGMVGGLKFPTGKTKAVNSIGTLFEPELQPGTGSLDYIAGAVLHKRFDRISLVGNTIYVINTKGSQDFEAGDVFIVSLVTDYSFSLGQAGYRTSLGADTVFEYQQKDKSAGNAQADSGGKTVLLGPIARIFLTDKASISTSILFPVYQKLGGVHQELDYEWNAAARIGF